MSDEEKSKVELLAEIRKLRKENNALKKTPPSPGASRGDAGEAETILVVDDNQDTRDVVAAMLEDLDYTVIETDSSVAALRVFAAQKERIHLVLADIVMPDGSGPEMVAQMRREKPGLKVVFMSGYAEDEIVHDEVFKIQNSDAAFIKKPFSLEYLGTMIRGQLDE